MPDKTAYELGARKLMAANGPDPRDDFSQEAAENRKPRLGLGLTEEVASNGKNQRVRDQAGNNPSPEHEAHPHRDTREAPAPNLDGAPGTANAPFKSKAALGDASNDPESDSAGEELKKPVKGAVGDALRRHGN
jgi:hypothetical protein